MKKDDEKEIKTALHRIMSFGGRRKRVENSLWKAKWLPVIVMLVRWYGTFDFYSNPREIFMDYRDNEFCVMWFYTIAYIFLPYYMWDKAVTHELCFRWKIPMVYLFSLNVEHLFYDSIIITMDMIYFDFILIGLTLLLYVYVGIKRI